MVKRIKVSRWGKRLAVRLPTSVIEALDIRAGDEVEIQVADARRLELRRTSPRGELLERLNAFRGRLPEGFVFDRDEANAR